MNLLKNVSESRSAIQINSCSDLGVKHLLLELCEMTHSDLLNERFEYHLGVLQRYERCSSKQLSFRFKMIASFK
jgi:hypothetical protein